MICHRVEADGEPTDPADRTGTIGVEAFDAAYGAGFQASDDSPHAAECELVEDGGAFVVRRRHPRTEARLARTGPDGDVSMGLAGSLAAGGCSSMGTHRPASTG